MDHERKKTVFYPGEIVFAKMKSFPAWPARILDNRFAPSPSPPNKVAVVFYGTNELGYIRNQDLYDYAEFLELFGVEKKIKGFNEGLVEAAADFHASTNANAAAAAAPAATSAASSGSGDHDNDVGAGNATAITTSKKSAKKDTKIVKAKKAPPMTAAESERQSIIDELQQVQQLMATETIAGGDSSKRVRKPKIFQDFVETPAASKRNSVGGKQAESSRVSSIKTPKLKLILREPTKLSPAERQTDKDEQDDRRKTASRHSPPLEEDDEALWMKIKSEYPDETIETSFPAVALERTEDVNAATPREHSEPEYEYEASIWSENVDIDNKSDSAQTSLPNVVKQEQNECTVYNLIPSPSVAAVVAPSSSSTATGSSCVVQRQNSDETPLPGKRIRKKKTFSDDFVSPDVIFGASGQKQSKKPSSTIPKSPSALKPQIKSPLLVASRESSVIDDQRSESDVSRHLVIDEPESPSASTVSSPNRFQAKVESPPAAKVAPLKIKFGPFSSNSSAALALAKRKKKIDSLLTLDNDSPSSSQDVKPDLESSYETSTSSQPMSALLRSPPRTAPPVVARGRGRPRLSEEAKKKKKLPLKICLFSHRDQDASSASTTLEKSKKKKVEKSERKKEKRKYDKTGKSLKRGKTGKIIKREGESEEDFRIRRRLANRSAKQSRKLRKLFVTAYSYWMSIEMERMLKEQPTLTDFQEIRFTLQSKWRLLSNEEKEKYKILAKHERERRMINASLDKLGKRKVKQPDDSQQGEKVEDESEPSSSNVDTPVAGSSSSSLSKTPKNSGSRKRTSSEGIVKSVTKKSKKIKEEPVPASPPPYVDPDTFAVLLNRGLIGPTEARSRWWLYSNAPSAPGRRRVNRENSPPRALGADTLDASAVFRLMSKTFEQMGNRLTKGHENTSGAVGAFVDTLLDGFLVSLVHLLGTVKHIHPAMNSKDYHGNELCKISDLVEKTAFLTPM